MYSERTTVSVFMKGCGVRPEVNIEPEDGLLQFGNVLVGETVEKVFKIKNISSFAVKFSLKSECSGVQNKKKEVPFLLIPQTATIGPKETYEVKIVFQPDQVNNNFFEILLIDIPNQIKPKRVYLRGQAFDRQLAVRVFEPFEWRPLEELRRNYEKPLELINTPVSTNQKQRFVLEFMRDEQAIKHEYKFRAEQNRKRIVCISSCRLMDIKMEKAGNYELTPRVSMITTNFCRATTPTSKLINREVLLTVDKKRSSNLNLSPRLRTRCLKIFQL